MLWASYTATGLIFLAEGRCCPSVHPSICLPFVHAPACPSSMLLSVCPCIHSLSTCLPVPSSYQSPPQDSITVSCRLATALMHACCFIAEILLETRFNVQVEVSSPPLTSAASPGPWSQSLFAFMPSWPRKTFLKAESSRTHHLVSDKLETSIQIPKVGQEIRFEPTVYKNVTGF